MNLLNEWDKKSTQSFYTLKTNKSKQTETVT